MGYTRSLKNKKYGLQKKNSETIFNSFE